MQAVNVAWGVLGDRDARAAYDAELGIVRDEDRLVVEDHDDAEVVRAPAGLRRYVPLLVVLGLLFAFFVFTAYAGAGRS